MLLQKYRIYFTVEGYVLWEGEQSPTEEQANNVLNELSEKQILNAINLNDVEPQLDLIKDTVDNICWPIVGVNYNLT